MLDEQTIQRAAETLLAAAPPGSMVILFGSYARGEADERSDLDFLVVEPLVTDEIEEMVRMAEVLAPSGVPADVIVMSHRSFDYWKDTPNTLPYWALKEGRLYEQVA